MRSCQLRQISVCQFSSRSWSLQESLLRYESLGFDAIGICRQKINEHGYDSAIDMIHESKLAVSSLHFAGGFTGDGVRAQDAIEDTFEAIKTAARINAGVLIIHPGSINNHLFNHISKVYQSALDEIIPFAESHDVKLAIEPILDSRSAQFTFHHKLDHTLDLLHANPELGLILDLYHVGLSSSAFDRMDEFVNRISLVQLADCTRSSWSRQRLTENRRQSFRLPLGQGDIDIHRWLQRLNQLGYTGPLELEVYGSEVQQQCRFELLDQAQTYLATLPLRHGAEPETMKYRQPGSSPAGNNISN